jgi:hypothetical protein
LDAPFTDEARFKQLWAVTGGWPLLVERAAELAVDLGPDKALEQLAGELTTPTGAADFVAATTVGNVPLDTVFALAVDLGASASVHELIDVAASMCELSVDESRRAVEGLIRGGCLDDAGGEVQPEPVLAAAFVTTRLAAAPESG